jgi:hypothetical protein
MFANMWKLNNGLCSFDVCVAGYQSCIARQKSASAPLHGLKPEECKPLLGIQDYSRNLQKACRMTTVTTWQGMSVWRWMLFVGLFWPLQLVAYFIARAFTSLVQLNLFGGHVCSLNS